MCGEEVGAETNVCIEKTHSKILLLVQEDKSSACSSPEAQLVAEAIAAFQTNNAGRYHNLSLMPLQDCVFPAVTMIGTFPRFYKIKVTPGLDQAVRDGVYPEVQTIVERHTPSIPGSPEAGMIPLANRVVILRCYEAFKKVVFSGEGDYNM